MSNSLLNPHLFEPIIKAFPPVRDLAASVNANVPWHESLEEHLRKIKDLAAKNANRQKQLVAFEFYLQKLFQHISDQYGDQSTNNYSQLKNLINDYGGQACIVTFNYDLLMEQNLGEIIGDSLDSYITGDIKLIKLHGSCDWVYQLRQWPNHATNTSRKETPFEHLMRAPWLLTRLEEKNLVLHQNRVREYQQVSGDLVTDFVPAIAIPLVGKNEPICPADHLEHLRQVVLKKIDRILIIGWRAGDPYLLETMKQQLNDTIPTLIVSGKLNTARDVSKTLEQVPQLLLKPTHYKLSDFVKSPDSRSFFAESRDDIISADLTGVQWAGMAH